MRIVKKYKDYSMSLINADHLTRDYLQRDTILCHLFLGVNIFSKLNLRLIKVSM